MGCGSSSELSSSGDDDTLTVIVVHYNPCGFERRRRLANECLERLLASRSRLLRRRRRRRHLVATATATATPLLEVVAVELTYDGRPNEIDDAGWNPGDVRVIRRNLPSSQVMWHKEQLVNLAIRKLPPGQAKYVAWIDSDIRMPLDSGGDNNDGDDSWVRNTLAALSQHKMAYGQMWETCDLLGPDGSSRGMVVTSFAQQVAAGKRYASLSNRDRDYWHPGTYRTVKLPVQLGARRLQSFNDLRTFLPLQYYLFILRQNGFSFSTVL